MTTITAQNKRTGENETFTFTLAETAKNYINFLEQAGYSDIKLKSSAIGLKEIRKNNPEKMKWGRFRI